MTKFRLPRKIKKKMKGTIWLYPPNEKGSSLMAHPVKYQEDYTAIKKGIVKNILERRKTKQERKTFFKILDTEKYISDELLKNYVDNSFKEDFRAEFYQILLKAKKNKKAVKYYFHFVNSYELDTKSRISALIIDSIKEVLKKPYKKKRQGKRK